MEPQEVEESHHIYMLAGKSCAILVDAEGPLPKPKLSWAEGSYPDAAVIRSGTCAATEPDRHPQECDITDPGKPAFCTSSCPFGNTTEVKDGTAGEIQIAEGGVGHEEHEQIGIGEHLVEAVELDGWMDLEVGFAGEHLQAG